MKRFNKKVNFKYFFRWKILFLIGTLLCLSSKISAQIRPNSVSYTSFEGVCAGCSITDEENAYDISSSTRTTMDVAFAGANSYGEVGYLFQYAVSVDSLVTFDLSFSGSVLSLLVDEHIAIFGRLNIILRDSLGNNILTINGAAGGYSVQVVDPVANRFLLHITDVPEGVAEVVVRSGNLNGQIISGRDLYIYDIRASNIPDALCEEYMSFPTNDYTNGDTLAVISDDDAAIASVFLSGGDFPDGATLQSTGEIIVNDISALEEGSYSFQVVIEDNNGDFSTCYFTIDLYAADIEAVYVISSGKPVNDYVNQDTLAVATDENGEIVASEVVGGGIPPGASISSNGSILVLNSIDLIEGTFDVEILTTDEFNGQTLSEITIVIHSSDIEATYTIESPKPVNDYLINDILAFATDENGEIISSTVSGTLPPGSTITTDGRIYVSDNSQLVEGSYQLEVETTDEFGGTTTQTIIIKINPADNEAEYIIPSPKPVNGYNLEEIIAIANDIDGPIVSAEVLSGDIPGGTYLLNNGNLAVNDTAALLSGTVQLTIITVDTNNGESINEISVEMYDPDIPAIYDVKDAFPVTDYNENDLLATVTDQNGPIVSAEIVEGELPAGAILQEDGTISIDDTSLLQSGGYNVTIMTTDQFNGITVSELTLVIGDADIESIYSLEIFYPVSDYSDGFVLAHASDENGEIVETNIIEGQSPSGTRILEDGSITVNNATQLIAGDYIVNVKTIDEFNGTTDHELSLTFYPDDIEAVYEVYGSKPISDYNENELVAIASDENGEIIESSLLQGKFPSGMVLLENSEIKVSDPNELIIGNYEFIVRTRDEFNGVTDHDLSLDIYDSDIEAIYTLQPAKPKNDYQNGETIAFATDENGPIVSSVLESGQLPQGTGLFSNGDIRITNSSNLISGIYLVGILTTDEYNGTTTSFLTIKINSDDIEAVYHVNSSKNVDQYVVNEIVAYPTDENGPIIGSKVVQNQLPGGLFLNSDGQIKVLNTGNLVPGDYLVTIETTDIKGGVSNNLVLITFNDEGDTDQEAAYSVYPSKRLDQLSVNDVLAIAVDPDGDITNSEILQGKLPDGLILNSNSSISVSNLALVPGVFPLVVVTKDEYEGSTTHNVSIVIEEKEEEDLVVGLANQVSIPVMMTNDMYEMNFSIKLENLSEISALITEVENNLGETFQGQNTFEIYNLASTGAILINDNYDGISDINLVKPGSELGAGEISYITFTLTLNPGSSTTVFNNFSTLTAKSSDGEQVFQDISDDGIIVDANGNGDPSEPGENDPTVIHISSIPSIGLSVDAIVSQQISDNLFQCDLTLNIGNYGNEILENIGFNLDLKEIFTDVKSITLIETSSSENIILDEFYDGQNNVTLINEATIIPRGAFENVTLSLQVTTTNNFGPFVLVPSISAEGGLSGLETTDEAVSGIDPDPNGNGNPRDTGEDGGTQINFQNATIAVAMNISAPEKLSNNLFSYKVILLVENIGNTSLSRISLFNDLSEVFGSEINFNVHDLKAGEYLKVNESFNGYDLIDMLHPGLSRLEPGVSDSITFELQVNPNGNAGTFFNSAWAYGVANSGEISSSDISNDGFLADPNENGNPSESGENTPSKILIPELPVIGLANEVSIPILQIDGSYLIHVTVIAENLGNEKLIDVSVSSDLANALPDSFDLISVDGGLGVSQSFDGISDTLLSHGLTIDVNEIKQLQYSLQFNPNQNFDNFNINAFGKGLGAISGETTTDFSTSGFDPDPNGDFDPDEEELTTVVVYPQELDQHFSLVSSNWLTSCEVQMTFELNVTNVGNVVVRDLQILNDFSELPAPLEFELGLVTSNQEDITNGDFDGLTTVEMLTENATLGPGQSLSIRYDMVYTPNGFTGSFEQLPIISGVSERLRFHHHIYAKDGSVLSIEMEEVEEFIPNAFSPNGDQIQDQFVIQFSCGVEGELKVFNRWGDLVYENSNYDNSWKGYANQSKFLGEPLPDGAYVYKLNLSNNRQRKGVVLIKRSNAQ